jgi:hypothetical protein
MLVWMDQNGQSSHNRTRPWHVATTEQDPRPIEPFPLATSRTSEVIIGGNGSL